MRKSLTVLGSVLSIMALTMVAMALPVFAGAGSHVERQNTSASGRSTSGNGQIVFRRYFNAAQTKGALFVMKSGRKRGPPDQLPTQSLEGQRSGVVS